MERELTGSLAQVYLTSFKEGKAKVKIDLKHEGTPELMKICRDYVDEFVADNHDAISKNADEHLGGVPLFTIEAIKDNMGMDTRYDVDKVKAHKFISYVYTYCLNAEEPDFPKSVNKLLNKKQ